MQRRREEGYMLGLDVDEIEKRAFWFGAADAAEEMIGFHGLLGQRLFTRESESCSEPRRGPE